jgi:hypothetical protein
MAGDEVGVRREREDDAARISRGRLLQRTVVVVGGVAGLGALAATAAPAGAATGAAPKPIPGGLSRSFRPVPSHPAAHLFGPAPGAELSTITDFKGVVGATELRGKATGSDGSAYSFDADMRFMQGLYAGEDNRLRQGTFGFI